MLAKYAGALSISAILRTRCDRAWIKSCGALHNPRGEHHTRNEFLHKNAPQGLTTNTPTHSRALHFCASPAPLFPLFRLTSFALLENPLNPAALTVVPFSIVLVRVRYYSDVPMHVTLLAAVCYLLCRRSSLWLASRSRLDNRPPAPAVSCKLTQDIMFIVYRTRSCSRSQ